MATDDDELNPELIALMESVERGEGWVAWCTDCETGAKNMTLAEAEVWPTLHRVLSPTCQQYEGESK